MKRSFIVIFLLLNILSPLSARNDLRIAYLMDDPKYVDIWLEKNPDKKINEIKLYVTKKNIALEAIKRGANVNYKDENGRTPIFRSAGNNCYEVAKALIEKGAKVNVKVGRRSYDGAYINTTPLHEAAKRATLEMVQLLVENGAKVNAKDIFGKTPLHEAAKDSLDHKVITYLISKGAKKNIKEKDKKETPLHFAVKFRNSATTIALIANGANLTKYNYQKKTPLEYASTEKPNRPKIKAILEKASTPEIQSLIKAKEGKNVREILTKIGADAKKEWDEKRREKRRQRRLQQREQAKIRAAKKKEAQTAKVKSVKEKNNQTPLDDALKTGNQEIVHLLQKDN